MIHFGDITKLSGYTLPVVDIITGGSPCQDLSVAGKRAGLDGERSGLFMEQIRIVKEMRERDRRTGRTGWLIRPRFMVWENVPGAFSSNKGKDFQAVLTEIVKIAEPDAPDVPLPDKGKWSHSGCLYDELGRWSVAWRLHDAQFWGVPQRRKRIALVADFGGLAAPEILFEREGLSRDSEPGETEREGTADSSGGGAYPTVARDLTRRYDGSPCIDRGPNIVYDDWYIDTTHADDVVRMNDTAAPLQARDHKGGKLVFDARGNGDGEIAPTMTGDHQNRVTDYTALCFQNTGHGWRNESDIGATIRTPCGGDSVKANLVSGASSIVRRLTPLECERLQGYPDGWTDIGEWIDSKGKKHKEADSPRYKALGNSIALPFWAWMARRICAQYERPMTMGSLFDGIGGFPLVFERAGAKAVWASEIEEFPIAVTKKHFPEEDTK